MLRGLTGHYVPLPSAAGEKARAFVPKPLPPDPPPPPLEPQDNGGCERRFAETYLNHAPDLIQPKDFAFVPGGWTPSGSWTFHLFYIRQNQYLSDVNTTKNWLLSQFRNHRTI